MCAFNRAKNFPGNERITPNLIGQHERTRDLIGPVCAESSAERDGAENDLPFAPILVSGCRGGAMGLLPGAQKPGEGL